MAGETLNLTRFIPKFILNLFAWNSFNNAYILGQRGPIYISTTQPKELFNTIPELRAIIGRDATMFSNMKLYKRNKSTKEIIPDPQLDLLLDNPNCTQSQNQFLKQYRMQLLCYGNQFIYKNKVNSKSYPVALWNLSPFYLQPVLTGKIFEQLTMGEIIERYHIINTLSLNGVDYNIRDFETDDILFTRIEDLDNPIIGRSPIASMQDPLSNIKTAYRARNVGHQMVGVGMVSPKAVKDMTGSAIPMNPKEKKDMEDQFGSDYGIGIDQRRTILAKASVDYTALAIPTKDMLLIEEVNADIVAICNVLNMNPQMFLTNTTYENLRASIVQTYQDNIIPAAEEFCQALTPFLGLKPNEEICASYEHLSILKENKLKGMMAIQAIVTALAQAVEAGILDAKSATNILANELGLSADSY